MTETDLVLDSWAILAFYRGEPSAPDVRKILADGHAGRLRLWMTVINLGEIWYSQARHATAQKANQALAELEQLNITWVDADKALTLEAADFKSRFRMSYADAFAVALTKRLGSEAELVTGDLEFKAVESEIKIRWLRR
jgi:uncharacterized protein